MGHVSPCSSAKTSGQDRRATPTLTCFRCYRTASCRRFLSVLKATCREGWTSCSLFQSLISSRVTQKFEPVCVAYCSTTPTRPRETLQIQMPQKSRGGDIAFVIQVLNQQLMAACPPLCQNCERPKVQLSGCKLSEDNFQLPFPSLVSEQMQQSHRSCHGFEGG